MNCRFCDQWNPEGEQRCCFCTNLLDGTEDRTLAGTADYLQNVRVTGPLPTADGRPGPGAPDSLLEIVKQMNAKERAALGAILAGALVLFFLFVRC